jgi:hypothetical protein
MRKFFLFIAVAAPLGAQQAPAVRLINAPDASTKAVFGLVAAVRQLPGGRVLVNDVQKRQLLMFDNTLATSTIVADSVSGGANAYGPSGGAIIPYFADSTLFIDPRDLSMFVIDPAGAISRVAAVPRSQDAASLGSNIIGSPALDSKGRIVYRAGFGRMIMGPPAGGRGGMPTFADPPDSTAIVRVDLTSRKVDTAAYFKIPKTKMNMVQNEKGMSITSEINPMQLVDDWTVTDDGSIAIIRGRDYHIDWVDADNHITSSAKIAFDWQRLSDEDKVAIIDSSRTAMEAARAKAMAAGGSNPLAAAMGAAGGGNVVMSFNTSGGGGDGVARKAGAEGAAGGLAMSPLVFVNPSELPDYRPAVSQGSAKADIDGNVWIRTSATRAGSMAGPIYDVVNRQGALIDRVQIPSGRQIVGFGKGGVVYMMARDDKGAWIERTHR